MMNIHHLMFSFIITLSLSGKFVLLAKILNNFFCSELIKLYSASMCTETAKYDCTAERGHLLSWDKSLHQYWYYLIAITFYYKFM